MRAVPMVPLTDITDKTEFFVGRYDQREIGDVFQRRYYIEEWYPEGGFYGPKLTPGRKAISVEGKSIEDVKPEKVMIEESILKDLMDRPKYVVIFNDKHCSQYYYARTSQDFGKIFFTVLKDRFENGYFEEKYSEQIAKAIQNKNYVAITCFIESHRDYEYEGYEIVKMVEV